MDLEDIKLVLNPQVVVKAQMRYGTTDPLQIMSILRINCTSMINLFGRGDTKVYWSDEDKETAMVIFQNKLMRSDKSEKLLSSMERCEDMLKDEDPSSLEIIDNLSVLLDFCMKKQSRRSFNSGLDNVGVMYDDVQIGILCTLMQRCVRLHTRGSSEMKIDFLTSICKEALDNLVSVYNNHVPHLAERLRYTSSRLKNRNKKKTTNGSNVESSRD